MIPMDNSRPISRLVRMVHENAREWGAMFGAVFELSPDRRHVRPVSRVLGTNTDHVLADSLMKVMSDQVLESVVTSKNWSIRIKGPKEAFPFTRGHWHLCVITEDLDALACVALMVELPGEDQATEHLAKLAAMVVSTQSQAIPKADPKREIHFNQLFKTCLTHSSHALLVAGLPGFLLHSRGVQQMRTRALPQEKLQDLIKELLPASPRQMDIPGVMQFDVPFESRAIFRIAVLGQPGPRAITITLLEKDAPAIADEGQGWSHADGNWYDFLKQSISGVNRNILLVDNSPPLLWSAHGVLAVRAKILQDDDVRLFASKCVKLEQTILNPNGYMEYGLGIGGAPFSAYLFDYFTSPMNVLVKRLQKKPAE